jgi:hypothetical protein
MATPSRERFYLVIDTLTLVSKSLYLNGLTRVASDRCFNFAEFLPSEALLLARLRLYTFMKPLEATENPT